MKFSAVVCSRSGIWKSLYCTIEQIKRYRGVNMQKSTANTEVLVQMTGIEKSFPGVHEIGRAHV